MKPVFMKIKYIFSIILITIMHKNLLITVLKYQSIYIIPPLNYAIF